MKNSRLLARAQEDFDVLITKDGSMSSQLDLAKLYLAIVALRAPTNRLADTSPLMRKVLVLLPTLKPGKVAKVSLLTRLSQLTAHSGESRVVVRSRGPRNQWLV